MFKEKNNNVSFFSLKIWVNYPKERINCFFFNILIFCSLVLKVNTLVK